MGKTIIFIIIIILFLVYLYSILKTDTSVKSDDFRPAGINYIEKKMLDECRVPTLTGDKCFFTEYNRCPRYNGSYDQCTNNYIPEPNQNNCPCNNRTFEMCPKQFKISEKCYNEKLRLE